jgi:hypothetical protein
MSVQATSWVWDHSEAKGNDRLVLLAIADAANKHGGRSCQAAGTLAKMCRISPRTVQRSIKKLLEIGEITLEGHDRKYQTNIYSMPGVITGNPVEGGQNDGASDCRYDNEGTSLRQNVHVATTELCHPTPSTPTSNEVTPERARKRAERLPEGWMPDQGVIEQMRAECPGVNLEAEHRKFADHWAAASGRTATKADWNAAWRNWIRRAAEHTQRSSGYVPSWQKRLEASASMAPTDHAPRNVFEIEE